eukprot:2303305-Prymnesium_polylepis.1
MLAEKQPDLVAAQQAPGVGDATRLLYKGSASMAAMHQVQQAATAWPWACSECTFLHDEDDLVGLL